MEALRDLSWEEGFNAMACTYDNMLNTGIIDPKKVTRSTLQNAIGVASMVLTTQALVTEAPNDGKDGSQSRSSSFSSSMMTM